MNIQNFEDLQLYKGYQEWKAWGNKKFGSYTSDQGIYFKEELIKSGAAVKPGLCVLEIGFGNGDFAGWATQQRFVYCGLETIDALVDEGQKLGYRVTLSSGRLDTFVSQESQDLIVAFDVFEHFTLEELGVWLVRIREWLKPGGLLIFRMPSGDSPFSRAIQHGDLTHKITLGSSAIRQLANFYDYRVEVIKAPVLPVFGIGFNRYFRRVLVLFGRVAITKFVQAFFHDNAQTVIASNMIVALRKGA